MDLYLPVCYFDRDRVAVSERPSKMVTLPLATILCLDSGE